MALDTFHHAELDKSASEIRLVRFSPRENDTEIISCELRSFNLNDKSCPPYRALSYEWGAESPVCPILVNGYSLNVRQNLHHYLEQVECKRYAESWVWIDQISINQADIAERNHQVQQMGTIFRKATMVIAWIGLADVHSDRAASAVSRLDLCKEICEAEAKAAVATLLTVERLSVLYILQRSYFRRLWIVQEILLAKEVTVACGHARIPWRDIRHVAKFLGP